MEVSKLTLVMPKPKVIKVAILVALMLLGLGLVPRAFSATETTFHDVTVDSAYDMVTSGDFPDLVILDVRYQHEYDAGHLYDAFLVPYDELEKRIDELEEHRNHEVIVYCGSGYRSQIACEVLVEHNFAKVYNMLGGILAWLDAGYPIWTTYHHVTVTVLDGEVVLQIEPLLLDGCETCGCLSDSEPQNIQTTVLEEEEGYKVVLVTYEVDGATFESTIATSVLWSYNEVIDDIDRTVRFTSTEITEEDRFTQFYSLSYVLQHAEYSLTLHTLLMPLNSETYNRSFTIMSYAPAGKSEAETFEFVEFDSSVTLSQMYAVLDKVAKEVGKVYEKSGDETLVQYGQGYYIMAREAKYLSKLVEKQLPEYDREILESSALLMDSYELCLTCKLVCQLGYLSATALCLLAAIYLPIIYPFCALLFQYAYGKGLGCAIACALGGYCEEPGIEPIGDEITYRSGSLSGDGATYTFSVDGLGEAPYTVVMVGNEDADFDLYARWGLPPTTSSYHKRSLSGYSLEYFTATGSGKLYVMVRSWRGSGHWRCNIISGEPSADGLKKHASLSGSGDTDTYSLSGTGHAWVYLAGPGSGDDYDLYIKWNSAPTFYSYHDIGYSTYSDEICDAEGSGKIYYMVRSHRGSGWYTMLALVF